MDFIALVLAIGALLAFRTLNKRTLALEDRFKETSLELAALRADLGRGGPGPAEADEAAPIELPEAPVVAAETSVPSTPTETPATAQGDGLPVVVPAAPTPVRSLEERLTVQLHPQANGHVKGRGIGERHAIGAALDHQRWHRDRLRRE